MRKPVFAYHKKKKYLQDKVEKGSEERLDFWGFQRKYRPDINYDSDYSYLRFPLQFILSGERRINFQKGSQLGISEAIITYSFFSLVILQKNIFYMLPTIDDASDFSAARFNPAIESNTDLKRLFKYDNVQHKRYKNANLYLRGSNSQSKLKTVSVSILIKDELDEMSPEGLAIVDERLSGSKEKQEISLSTPTLPDRGIANEIKDSETYELFIACPQCGYRQVLDFDGLLGHGNNVSISRRCLICQHCNRSISDAEKTGLINESIKNQAVKPQRRDKFLGWTKTREGKGKGFAISQLYSPTITIEEILEKWEKADNELLKQAFFNHKLGVPYVAEGSRLTGDIILSRVGSLHGGSQRAAGIDVSLSELQYVTVLSWYRGVGPVVEAILRLTWEELPQALVDLQVTSVVIDSMPERKQAKVFRDAFYELCHDERKQVWLAEYATSPKNFKELYKTDEDEGFVKINRTEILDIVLDRFRKDTVLVNSGVSGVQFEDFSKHLCNLIRGYREVRGELESYYYENGPDHYAHSLAYGEVAVRLMGPEMVFDSVGGTL